MVSRTRTKTYIALLLNILLIGLEIYAASMTWHVPKRELIVFYTEDSNLLALAASILMTASILVRLRSGTEVPYWVRLLRFMATCCLAVTFFTVVFILTPMVGVENWRYMLLEGNSLYLHFLCPLIAMFLLVFLETEPVLNWKCIIWSLIPTFVYGVILAVLNILRIVDGPYPFLRVYEQSVLMSVFWIIIMQSGAFMIAFLLWVFNRLAGKVSRKKEKNQ